ncbi:MAG: PDZ domain-containing protein, partial [Lentisphaeria bacterium]|nr:PDZ domain-containing protein [Lentisphaeria bacterium]
MKRITAILVAILAAVVIVAILRRAAPVEPPEAPTAAVVNNASASPPARLEDYASMSRDELVDRLQEQEKQLAQKRELLQRNEDDFELLEEKLQLTSRRLRQQLEWNDASIQSAAASATLETQPLSRQDIDLRLTEYAEAFDQAFANGEGDAVLVILKDLRELREDGYPLLVSILNKVVADQRGDNTLGLTHRQFFRSFGREPDLFAYALQSNEASTQLRVSSVHALRWSDDDHVQLFIEQLPYETDETVTVALARALGHTGTPEAVEALGQALDRDYENNDTVESLVYALVRSGSESSAATLAKYAETATGDALATAEVALRMQASPEAGVGVTGITPHTQGESAGFEKGDVIVSYDGNPVRGRRSLIRLTRRSDPEEPVTIEYYRDGVKQDTQVYGGFIGVGVIT